jgi:dihydropteroate synthase
LVGLFPPDRVTIVGVINLTPDSFSDGGRFQHPASHEGVDVESAIRAASDLQGDGAHVIDVGGESTRPGASEVPVELELARTRDVVAALCARLGAIVSIDTRKAAVARAALEAGARIVNDVSGLAFDPALAEVVASWDATLVLGHARGTPMTMRDCADYDDVLSEVARELELAIARARAAGVPYDRLVVDPGIGFAKRAEDSLRVLAQAGWLRERLGLPVMIGASRKSFLGDLTGDPVDQRQAASDAACAIAAFAGADAVRVHDVKGAVRAVAVGRAAREATIRAAEAAA